MTLPRVNSHGFEMDLILLALLYSHPGIQDDCIKIEMNEIVGDLYLNKQTTWVVSFVGFMEAIF